MEANNPAKLASAKVGPLAGLDPAAEDVLVAVCMAPTLDQTVAGRERISIESARKVRFRDASSRGPKWDEIPVIGSDRDRAAETF